MLNRKYAGAIALTLLSGCSTTTPYVANDSIERAGLPTEQAAADEGLSTAQQQASPEEAEALYRDAMAAKAASQYESMLGLLMASADRNHPGAHYELARLLSEGKIVVGDKEASKLYLQRSSELGNPEAKRVLAWNTLRGDYAAADIPLGVSMMHEAAESSVRAQRELGMLYANIYKPYLDDPTQAEHYLSLSANSGDADAAYQLGRLKASSGDAIGAVEWYEKAIQAGNTKAGAALSALQNGEPIPPRPMPREQSLPLSGERLYRDASALLISRQRTMETEARAYAMLVLASELGSASAAQELQFLTGVKVKMDQENPSWLEEEKNRILAAPTP